MMKAFLSAAAIFLLAGCTAGGSYGSALYVNLPPPCKTFTAPDGTEFVDTNCARMNYGGGGYNDRYQGSQWGGGGRGAYAPDRYQAEHQRRSYGGGRQRAFAPDRYQSEQERRQQGRRR